MKSLILLCCVFLFQDVPFKPDSEFNIKIDYSFRHRPVIDRGNRIFEPTASSRQESTLLPYLILNMSILDHQNAVRFRLSSNMHRNIYQKKLKQGMIYPIEIGFTDDAKDRVTAHEYQVDFIDGSKNVVSRIFITINNDGEFFINGVKRGKF